MTQIQVFTHYISPEDSGEPIRSIAINMKNVTSVDVGKEVTAIDDVWSIVDDTEDRTRIWSTEDGNDVSIDVNESFEHVVKVWRSFVDFQKPNPCGQ